MIHHLTGRRVQVLVGCAALTAATVATISAHSALSLGCAALVALQLILTAFHDTRTTYLETRRVGDSDPPSQALPAQSAADSVATFARDLKQVLLSGNYRSIKSIAGAHKQTGMSRSTVYSAVSGTRLPSESTIRGLLSSVTDVSDDEIQRWLDRCARLATPASLVLTDPSDRPPRTRPQGYRYVTSIAAGLSGAAVGAITTILIVQPTRPATSAAATPSAPPTQLCTPLADLRTYQVPAHVANTQGQGVFARLQPQQNCHTSFLSEGTPVTVVCQDLHGPTITDTYGSAVRDWPVWDKLGSGAYVPDLYVDLPKEAKPGLVAQLPAC